jgi:hypothetical protein
MSTETKESKVKPNDTTTVFGTGKVPFMPLGKSYKVHKIAAEKLIEAGKAAKTKAEAEAVNAELPKAKK